MKKKHLFALLATVLLWTRMSAYDFSAVAQDYWQDMQYEIELYYTINQDGKTVTVTNGPAAYEGMRVNIPETVEYEGVTYTVTAIGYQAFMNSKINYVNMPNTVAEILKEAFAGSSVDSITFSKGLKHIRERALADTQLKHVTLHDGIETLGERAFYHENYGNSTWMGPLLSIQLPNSITHIGKRCFLNQLMENIVFPENLEVIEEHMFTRIVNVRLPNKLKKIASGAFYGCPIADIEFPSSLEAIEENAFNGCLLTEVVLPNSITTVGENAFSGNKFMTSIVFSSGMTHLPASVCSDCERLVDVTIPEGIISIGNSAFSGCKLLSHVTFPESVAEIGEHALSSTGIVDFKFPKAVTKIPAMMFYGCNMLVEYVIPNTIDEISRDAFNNCSNLRSIVIPSSVVSMRSGVFIDCASLQEVEIPCSLTEFGSSMFDGCISLSRVVLPNGFKKLSSGAFYECTSLKEITLPESLEEIESNAFANSGLTSIIVPFGVKKIYFQAFHNCEKLTKVVIPQSVAYMGGNMFYGCNNLTEVHYQRAILPEPTSYYESYTKIHANNVCTLYVPRGAKTVFEADEHWNSFMTIEEEDVPNVYYELSAKVARGKGSVTVDEENIANNKVDTLLNSVVTVTFVPSEGYIVESVLCNGEDITAELSETLQYEIASVEANYQFEVYYKEKPVTLHLVSGQGGSIDQQIEKGSRFICNFKEEEGWRVNTVLFNGNDVTAEWSAEDGYTTPAITGESTLSVSFEFVSSIVSQAVSRLKAYSKRNGILTLDGLTVGEQVNIYSIDGASVMSFVSTSEHKEIELNSNAVYLVCSSDNTIKVAL